MKNISEINMQKYIHKALDSAPAHFNFAINGANSISAVQVSNTKFDVKIQKKDVTKKISRAVFFDSYQPFMNDTFQNIRSEVTYRFLDEHQRIKMLIYKLRNLFFDVGSPFFNDYYYYQNELQKIQIAYQRFCTDNSFYMCLLTTFDFRDCGTYMVFSISVDESYPISLL